MKQVVVKGESVYECSVCKRKVRVPSNRFGLDVMQRCNITSGCRGSLSRVTLTKDINSTPAFPPEVDGVSDWFQRKILYTHQQPIEASKWLVKHNLGNKPIIHVYANQLVGQTVQLVQFQAQSVTILDLNTVELTFSKPVSGLAQCVSLASENLTNSTAVAEPVVSLDAILTTNAVSEISIATLDSSNIVTVELSYVTSSDTPNVNITYTAVDSTASLDSPWAGVRRVMVNGRRYVVRSFNLISHGAAAPIFGGGQIPNGSAFRFTELNGQPIKQHDVLVLLARTPFTTIDRIHDKYIDAALISSVDPELYWDAGLGYCRPSAVKTTYPAILVV